MGMPDVCLVPAPPAPPIPTPFPNMGQVAMATKTPTKVLIQNMPVIVMMSEIPMSQGDEAGTNGGVVSGQNMGKIAYMQASMKVLAEGKGVAMLTSMTGHNGASPNMPAGHQIAPSQVKVLVSP